MGEKIAKHELEKCLASGDYAFAQVYFNQLSFPEAMEMVERLAFDTKDIALYTFVVSMLLKDEAARLHYLASVLLVMPFCFLDGAYRAGLYHARKCLELEPHNDDYKELLLTFYDLPDRLITNEEALRVAYEIVKNRPSSQFALKIISQEGSSRENINS
jgi:hypothetical protein